MGPSAESNETLFDLLFSKRNYAADILRVQNGIPVEHWNVIQHEATQEQSKSGPPMFGNTFPKRP
jgi:hypothetical protein